MNRKVIDFKTSGYFPGFVVFFGAVLLLLAFLVLLTKPVIGIIMAVVSVVILTTHYRFGIDLTDKSYRDYLWILGFKNGPRKKFDAIQYLFIKKSKVSQTMHLRAASSTIHKEQFDGYLKFSENDKVHLISHDDKDKLIEKLRRISTALNTSIVDYTRENPQEV